MRRKETLQLKGIITTLENMGTWHIISLIVRYFFGHLTDFESRYGEEIIKIGDKFRTYIPFSFTETVREYSYYQMVLKSHEVIKGSFFGGNVFCRLKNRGS